MWIVVGDLVALGDGDAGQHPGQRLGDVIEGVVVVVADDHPPLPAQARARTASRGFSIVVDIARIMRQDAALEGTGNPDDDVVEAARRALGVADRAEREARCAPFQFAGGGIGDVGDEPAADEGEDVAAALFRAAGDVEGPQPQFVGACSGPSS